MLNPEDLLTEEAAARSMKRSRQWLQAERLAGRGPKFIMLGNRAHYDPADISAWLESRKQDPSKANEV